jgi:hypothetical protein
MSCRCGRAHGAKLTDRWNRARWRGRERAHDAAAKTGRVTPVIEVGAGTLSRLPPWQSRGSGAAGVCTNPTKRINLFNLNAEEEESEEGRMVGGGKHGVAE